MRSEREVKEERTEEDYPLWNQETKYFDDSALTRLKKENPIFLEYFEEIRERELLGKVHWGFMTAKNIRNMAKQPDKKKEIFNALDRIKSDPVWETSDNKVLTQEALDFVIAHPEKGAKVGKINSRLRELKRLIYSDCLPSDFFNLNTYLSNVDASIAFLSALPDIDRGPSPLGLPDRRPVKQKAMIVLLVEEIRRMPQCAARFTAAFSMLESKGVNPIPDGLFSQHPDQAIAVVEGYLKYREQYCEAPFGEYVAFLAAHPGVKAAEILQLLVKVAVHLLVSGEILHRLMTLLVDLPCNQPNRSGRWVNPKEGMNRFLVMQIQEVFRCEEAEKEIIINILCHDISIKKNKQEEWFLLILQILQKINQAVLSNDLDSLIKLAFKATSDVKLSQTVDSGSRYLSPLDSEVIESLIGDTPRLMLYTYYKDCIFNVIYQQAQLMSEEIRLSEKEKNIFLQHVWRENLNPIWLINFFIQAKQNGFASLLSDRNVIKIADLLQQTKLNFSLNIKRLLSCLQNAPEPAQESLLFRGTLEFLIYHSILTQKNLEAFLQFFEVDAEIIRFFVAKMVGVVNGLYFPYCRTTSNDIPNLRIVGQNAFNEMINDCNISFREKHFKSDGNPLIPPDVDVDPVAVYHTLQSWGLWGYLAAVDFEWQNQAELKTSLDMMVSTTSFSQSALSSIPASSASTSTSISSQTSSEVSAATSVKSFSRSALSSVPYTSTSATESSQMSSVVSTATSAAPSLQSAVSSTSVSSVSTSTTESHQTSSVVSTTISPSPLAQLTLLKTHPAVTESATTSPLLNSAANKKTLSSPLTQLALSSASISSVSTSETKSQQSQRRCCYKFLWCN